MKDLFSLPMHRITKIFSERFSDKIAITDITVDKNYTYKDLHAFTLKYLNYLSKYVQRKEDIVYINDNTIEHLFLFFACIEGGFRFVPINPKLKEKEIVLMLKQIKPKCLIYGSEFKGDVDLIRSELNIKNVFFIDDLRNLIEEIKEFNLSNCSPTIEDDVLILFTSGTTGIPKPARIPLRMILFNVFHTVVYWELNSMDATTIHTPMFHAGGLNVLTTPLLFVGGRLFLFRKFIPEKILELINEKKINLLFAVPTMFKMLIDSENWKNISLENMKLMISGGAPCPKFIFDEFSKKNFTLKQGFGMTEVGVNCFFITNEEAKKREGSVGKPMIFLEVNLVDENHHIVESEGTGVMWFKGPVLFNGYEGFALEETFNKSLGFCSGDVAYRDKEGYYWIKGRVKDIIIRGGENIYPSEIEKEVYNFSWIDECCLIGIHDDFWGEVPVLCITSRRSFNDNSIEEIFKNLKSKLASYKLPHKIVVLNEFPKNSTGKIVKPQLQEKIMNNDFIKIYKFK